MKASFTCGVCREKLTLTGTSDGIERARVMWLKGHVHPIATLTTGSTVTAAPVNRGYNPPAVVYEAALEARAGTPLGINPLEVLE